MPEAAPSGGTEMKTFEEIHPYTVAGNGATRRFSNLYAAAHSAMTEKGAVLEGPGLAGPIESKGEQTMIWEMRPGVRG